MRLDTAVIAALGMLSAAHASSIPRTAIRDTPIVDAGITNVTRSSKKWELKLQQAGEHECRKHGNNDDLVQYTDSGYYDKSCVNIDKKVNSTEIESLAWVANGHKLCPYNVKDCKGGAKHLLPFVFEDEKCYPFAGWTSYSVVKLSESCLD